MSPPLLRSALLAEVAGVSHAFFTRTGGVSLGLYDSLNAGIGSLDDPARVAENRARAAAALGGRAENLATCFQVHSAEVLACAEPLDWERPRADGLATRNPELVLGVLAADCAPVLIADGVARVVAAVHAGWRGAFAGVIGRAVEVMTSLGARPSRMTAAIGPCIGPGSYEVGLEFEARFEERSPAWSRWFAPSADPRKRLFDLPGFVLERLEAAGVERREWIGRDTFGETTAFFSHRRAVGRGESDYGRQISAIRLEPGTC